MHVLDHAASLTRWGLDHALPRVGVRAGARRGDLQARLILASGGPGGDRDGALPLDLFEEVRSHGPIHRTSFAYLTATHAVVKEVLGSPDVHAGVDFGGGGVLAPVRRWAARGTPPINPISPPSLLAVEPPEHTRYRKLVTRVFSVKAVQGLRERTQTIADQLLDDLEATSGPVDLVERYCALLPVTVIAEILGVPHADRGRVLEFGAGAAPSLDLGLPLGQFRQVERSLHSFDTWLDRHVAAVRADPGDDLLSQLVTAEDDDGAVLDDRELKATAGLVLAAGFETTVNLLGNGIVLLRQHPDQLAALLADPDGWPRAVDEVLRFDPPVLLTGRTVVRDTEVAGTEVARGSVVTTLLAAANRDPEVFVDPQRFETTRADADQHVSFSSGRHYCLGAALARMEGEIGLRTLLERHPDLALLPGAQRRTTRILRGWATLPATLAG